MAAFSKEKKCYVCGKLLYKNNVTGYCAICLKDKEYNERVKLWLETGTLPITIISRPRGYVREYIVREQEHKCAICGLSDIWNGSSLVFVLDHIDGDASNNKRKNLRLICPNCDSQLDTFKSKNKNSARTYDRDYRREHNK